MIRRRRRVIALLSFLLSCPHFLARAAEISIGGRLIATEILRGAGSEPLRAANRWWANDSFAAARFVDLRKIEPINGDVAAGGQKAAVTPAKSL